MTDRPLYRVIAAQIERRINSGHYEPDSPLPAEPVLEREFSVSRTTIRQALSILKQRGILYSQSGKGTLIRRAAIGGKSLIVTGGVDDLAYYAESTTYVPLDRTEMIPSHAVAEVLAIQNGENVVCMTGTRGNAKGPPFAFEEVYCPKELSLGVDNSNLQGRAIYNLIEQNCGLVVVQVQQEIAAVPAPRHVQRHLHLSTRQCVLLASRYYSTQDGRVVQIAYSHYDTTRFKYVTTMYAD